MPIKVSSIQKTNPVFKTLASYDSNKVKLVTGGDGINSSSNSEALIEDFQINLTTSVLYLQLSFHIQKPFYIGERMKALS